MANNQYHYAFTPDDVEQDDCGHRGHDDGAPCRCRAAHAYWQEPLEAGLGSESVQYDPRSTPTPDYVEEPNQPWGRQPQPTPQPYFYQPQNGATYNEHGASHVTDVAMGNYCATNEAWMPNVPQGAPVYNESESDLESMGVSAGSFHQESTLKQYAVHKNERPIVSSQRSHERGQPKPRKKSKHSSKTYRRNHPKEAKARIESCDRELYNRFEDPAVDEEGNASTTYRE